MIIFLISRPFFYAPLISKMASKSSFFYIVYIGKAIFMNQEHNLAQILESIIPTYNDNSLYHRVPNNFI